jgi:hypothetical protein
MMADDMIGFMESVVVGRSNHNQTTTTVLHYCFCKSNESSRDGSESEATTGCFQMPSTSSSRTLIAIISTANATES